jgi:hypothetical protein
MRRREAYETGVAVIIIEAGLAFPRQVQDFGFAFAQFFVPGSVA